MMYYDRGHDLSPEDRRAVEAAVEVAMRKASNVEGVWVTVHDDRSRAVDHGKRMLGAGAAGLAQRHLKIADELMRMAGNAQHNSPNGFDRVAEEVLAKTLEQAHSATGEAIRMQRELLAWVERGGWRK